MVILVVLNEAAQRLGGFDLFKLDLVTHLKLTSSFFEFKQVFPVARTLQIFLLKILEDFESCCLLSRRTVAYFEESLIITITYILQNIVILF